ncbi:MAG: cation:proton antiporter, partial [Yaniella sp.]|nr:cation:proton antiporter [Yaniella sp.]
LTNPHHNSVYLRSLSKIAVPILVVVSLILLFRGHNEPGGGFVGALVTGSAFALLYLAAPADEAAPIRLPYKGLIGTGVALGSAVGVYGLVDGSYLTPIYMDIFGFELNSSLLFDIGVYFAVLGLILGAFNMLGTERGLAETVETPPEPTTGPPGIRKKNSKHSRQREVTS